MVFQFHDDTTVNKFRIVVLLRQIWMYGEKEMVEEDSCSNNEVKVEVTCNNRVAVLMEKVVG